MRDCLEWRSYVIIDVNLYLFYLARCNVGVDCFDKKIGLLC
jgi:hypothetical protein